MAYDMGAWRGAYEGEASPEAAGMIRMERRIDMILGRQAQPFASMVSGKVSKDEYAALDEHQRAMIDLLQQTKEILARMEAKNTGMAAAAQAKGIHTE